ncbi:MAG TPA: hypothetical protein VKN35_06185 [Xanthomonadales bacterium]|nr:hypothetical protein [Xanthomonadales bacterium]
MNTRLRKVVLLSTLSFVLPAPGWAATEQTAMSACAGALAANIEESQGSPVGFQLAEEDEFSSRRLRGVSTFHLDASDSKTQKVVARVDCTVNSAGEVIRLKELNLNDLSAVQRSRS